MEPCTSPEAAWDGWAAAGKDVAGERDVAATVAVAGTIDVVVRSHSGHATERNDRSDWEMALGLGRNGEGMFFRLRKYDCSTLFRHSLYIISFERISAWCR